MKTKMKDKFQIETNTQNDFAHLDSATFTQRLMAFVLDSLLVSALLGAERVLIAALNGGPRPSGGSSSRTADAVVFLVYYVVMQMKYQGTLGKRIVGLRVVSENSTNQLTFVQLGLRESLGKSFSFLLIGVGFLMILFSDGRKSLHDMLFKTRVVSLASIEGGGFLRQIAILIAVLFGLGAGTAGLLYFTVLYTPYPVEQMARLLRAEGWEFKGIHGSIKKGLSVDSIKYRSQDYHFDFNDVSFSISRATACSLALA